MALEHHCLRHHQLLSHLDIRLFALKPLHAQLVIEYFRHMFTDEGRKMIINGFRKAGIYDAYDEAKELKDLGENPFLELSVADL